MGPAILAILILATQARNNLTATEVLHLGESLVYDENNSFIATVLAKQSEKLAGSPYIEVFERSYSTTFILGKSMDRDDILNFFIEYTSGNYREITIYKKKGKVQMEIRCYSIEHITEEQKITAKINKVDRYIKRFDLKTEDTDFDYLDVIHDFFSGFLVVFKSTTDFDLKLKFYYHLHSEKEIFDYNTIIVDKFEEKINDDIGKMMRMKNLDKTKCSIYFDLFHLKNNLFETKEEQKALFLHINQNVLIYTISNYDDFYPELLKIINDKDNILREEIFIKYFSAASSSYYIYKRLAIEKYVIENKVDDPEFLMRYNSDSDSNKDEKGDKSLVYSANCYRFLNRIYIYNCSTNIHDNWVDITRKELILPTLGELGIKEYLINKQSYEKCRNRKFIEVLDYLVFLCQTKASMDVYKVDTRLSRKKFVLAISLEPFDDYVVQSDYTNRIIVIASHKRLGLIQLFNSFFKVSMIDDGFNETEMIDFWKDETAYKEPDQANAPRDPPKLSIALIPKAEEQSEYQLVPSLSATFNYDNKTNVVVTDIVKGNFLDVVFEYKDPFTERTNTIRSDYIIRQYSFQFDMIRNFYSYSIVNQDKMHTYDDLKSLDFSFFIENDEQLVYLKNNRINSIYEFNELYEHSRTNEKKEGRASICKGDDKKQCDFKIKQFREKYFLTRKEQELRGLSSLFYCNILRRNYLSSGVVFHCKNKQTGSRVASEYYYCKIDKQNCQRLEELTNCDNIYPIDIMSIVLCKRGKDLELFHFDSVSVSLTYLDIDIDKELADDYLTDFKLYNKGYYSEFVTLYNQQESKTKQKSGDKGSDKTIYNFNIIISKFSVTHKQRLKFLTQFWLKFEDKVEHFFFEKKRLIFITAKSIIVYYWDMSIREPVQLKASSLKVKGHDITILNRPLYQFYKNSLFSHSVNSGKFNNDFLVFLANINNRVGLVSYNINSANIGSFETFLDLMSDSEYRPDEVIVRHHDFLMPRHKFVQNFFFRGVSILIRKKLPNSFNMTKKATNRKSDSVSDYRLLIYIPQKKNIEIDFSEYKKEQQIDLNIGYKSQIDPSGLIRTDKVMTTINLGNYQNVLKLADNNLELETISSTSGTFVYKANIHKSVTGNVLEEKLILDFKADNFGDVVTLDPIVISDVDYHFPSSLAEYLRRTDFDKISLSRVYKDEYIISTDKFAVLMKHNRVLESFPLHKMFVLSYDYLRRGDAIDCLARPLPFTDVVLNICHIKDLPKRRFSVLPNFFNTHITDQEYITKSTKQSLLSNYTDISIQPGFITLYNRDTSFGEYIRKNVQIISYSVNRQKETTIKFDKPFRLGSHILFYDFVKFKLHGAGYIYAKVTVNSLEYYLNIKIVYKPKKMSERKLLRIRMNNRSLINKIIGNISNTKFKLLFDKYTKRVCLVFYLPGDAIMVIYTAITKKKPKAYTTKNTTFQRVVFLNNYFSGLSNVRLVGIKFRMKRYLIVVETRKSKESLVSLYSLNFNIKMNRSKTNVFNLEEKAFTEFDFKNFNPIEDAMFPTIQKVVKGHRILDFSVKLDSKATRMGYQNIDNQVCLRFICEDKIKEWVINRHRIIRIKQVPIRSEKAVLIVSNDYITERLYIDLTKYKQELSEHMKEYVNVYLAALIATSLLMGFAYPLLKWKFVDD